MQVEVRVPEVESSELSVEGPAPCLDFVASTATLDRYHEVIEPAGWRLDSYRRNPVFQNAHNYGDVLFTLGRAVSTEVRTVASGQALCQGTLDHSQGRQDGERIALGPLKPRDDAPASRVAPSPKHSISPSSTLRQRATGVNAWLKSISVTSNHGGCWTMADAPLTGTLR